MEIQKNGTHGKPRPWDKAEERALVQWATDPSLNSDEKIEVVMSGIEGNPPRTANAVLQRLQKLIPQEKIDESTRELLRTLARMRNKEVEEAKAKPLGEKWVTVQQAAELTGISKSTLYLICQAHRRAWKMRDGQKYVRVDKIKKYAKRKPAEPKIPSEFQKAVAEKLRTAANNEERRQRAVPKNETREKMIHKLGAKGFSWEETKEFVADLFGEVE